VYPIVKSHVLPQALIQDFRKSRKAAVTYPDLASRRTKFIDPANGYFGYFACSRCEAKFKRFDDEAIKFCRVLKGGARTVSGTWFYGDIDPDLLRGFFVTYLLRAHYVKTYPYTGVRLGKFARSIGRKLLRRKPAFGGFVTVVHREVHSTSDVIVYPTEVLVDGVSYWRMVLPGFSAIVKVSSLSADYVERSQSLSRGAGGSVLQHRSRPHPDQTRHMANQVAAFGPQVAKAFLHA
jgi:hypothetical protein